MRVRLGYRYSRYIDLSDTVANAETALSPFDLEHIVVENVVSHPAIRADMTVGDGDWISKADCSNPVAVAKDKMICNAMAGFSNSVNGLAIEKTLEKGYRVSTNRFVWMCEEIVYASVPGAIVVACYDGKHTSFAIASFNGLFHQEEVYRGKPIKCGIGYRTAACVFEDNRTIVYAYPSRIYEIGFPIDAVALSLREEVIGRSGKWLVLADPEEPKPLVIAENTSFVGFQSDLPAFVYENKLYVLDGGSLVEKLVLPRNSIASAFNVVVVENENSVTIFDQRLKSTIQELKDPDVWCHATKFGVVCCRGGFCGLVEPGESIIELEPLTGLEEHGVAINSDVYVKIHYKDSVVKIGGGSKLVDGSASVLKPCRFALSVEHLLGFNDVVVKSPAKPVRIDVERAVLYISTGMHICGGVGLLKLAVKSIEKPSRVAIRAFDMALEPGKEIDVCVKSLASSKVDIIAVDTVANDSIVLTTIEPEIIFIPTPYVRVDVQHLDGLSEVSIEADANIVEKAVCCSNICRELNESIDNCRLPAYIAVTVEKNGFIYRFRRDIEVPDLLDAITRASDGVVVYRRGGFVKSVIIPNQPDIPPIYGAKIYLYSRAMRLLFNSRGIGRYVAVLPNGYTKTGILKHGLNEVTLPVADKIMVIVDVNKRWIYTYTLKLEDMLLAGYAHAKTLLSALGKVVKH